MINEKDIICAAQHKDTLLWHGLYEKYRPKPSGADRWILCYSTTTGYKKKQTALDKIITLLILAGIY